MLVRATHAALISVLGSLPAVSVGAAILGGGSFTSVTVMVTVMVSSMLLSSLLLLSLPSVTFTWTVNEGALVWSVPSDFSKLGMWPVLT